MSVKHKFIIFEKNVGYSYDFYEEKKPYKQMKSPENRGMKLHTYYIYVCILYNVYIYIICIFQIRMFQQHFRQLVQRH